MKPSVRVLPFCLLLACQGPGPHPGPTAQPTASPSASASASPGTRTAAGLNGCWQESGNPQRRQYYTATGPDSLELRLVVSGSERRSQVRLKADGFLEILGEPSLGETLQWVGDQLIFRINGSQTAVFTRCSV